MSISQNPCKTDTRLGKPTFKSNRRQKRNLNHQKLGLELLEDRRLLSIDSPQLELFSVSPALFVENQGQWADSSIRYLHQGNGANVAMTDAGPVFQVFRRNAADDSTSTGTSAPDLPGVNDLSKLENAPAQSLQFSASFLDANTVSPTGLEQAETQFSYCIGEMSNWHSAVPSFTTVSYRNLYSGIELKTWGQRDSLKYEFHVVPNADYHQIKVHYTGIEGLSLADNGSLQVNLGKDWGELTDDAPYIYQIIDGKQTAVTGQFHLIDSQTYTFTVTGTYDPTRELVIDPDLAWTTYIGGSNADFGNSISLDASGNAFVTGKTSSMNFSGKNNTYRGGSNDVFVAKISTSGTLAWATYLGGNSEDSGNSISVDAVGNAFVTGNTESTNFSGASNSSMGFTDAFVAKISSEGSLCWATYLGGNSEDSGFGISTDSSGNAFVTGNTMSADFSAKNNAIHGSFDAFVAKVSSAGTLAWATYLGGVSDDEALNITADSTGNALVTGWTRSANFANANNTRSGSYDAFVAKVSANGITDWATYLGGSINDQGTGISSDASGNALVAGWTLSEDFSGANNLFQGGSRDVFAAKISPTGIHIWATYIGGSGDDYGCGVAMKASGNAFVTGYTNSTNFSQATNSNSGSYDAFMADVSPAGTITSATYFGGIGDDYACGICMNTSGDAWLTGYTSSTNFPGKNNDYFGGAHDAFVAKITFAIQPATRTWDGGGTDDNWSTPANWVGDIAPSPGDNLVFPANTARMDNINDYSSDTVFGSISVSGGEYHIQINSIKSNAVEVQNNAVLTVGSIVCDTLTIGTHSAASLNAVATFAIDPPQADASVVPAQKIEERVVIDRKANFIDSILEQPIAVKTASTITEVVTTDSVPNYSMEPEENFVMDIAWLREDEAPVKPSESLDVSAGRQESCQTAKETIANTYLHAFFSQSPILDQPRETNCINMTDILVMAKKQSSPELAEVRNARNLAVQSITMENRRILTVEDESSEFLVGKPTRKQDKLPQKAADDLSSHLILHLDEIV